MFQSHKISSTIFGLCLALSMTNAHMAPFAPGMYCQSSSDNAAVQPLFDMAIKDWWMHAADGCSSQPPPAGEFLELPAGGSFQVEMAENKVCTTMSDDPLSKLGNFGDYESYDAATYGNFANGSCITSPNLHARNRSDAAGSAFAISYTSDITKVTAQNLVVFSVAPNTPFERIANFDVPAAMPACPAGGCICAWGWVPNGCGAPNMYMLPYRCKVTGASKTQARTLHAPKAPTYCANDSSRCVSGAKQMIYAYQTSGNNIVVPESATQELSPGYSWKNGFSGGAQNDIFTTTPAFSSKSHTWHYSRDEVDAEINAEDSLRPRSSLRFARNLVPT